MMMDTTTTTNNSSNRTSNNRLDLSRADLNWAVQQGLLTQEQVEPLWQRLLWRYETTGQHEQQPRLSSSNVAYYIGTVVIGLGMFWILFLAWSRLWGGWAVALIAAAYMAVLTWTGHVLWHRGFGGRQHWHYQQIGGLLIATAVSILPIAVYGIQEQMGLWYRPTGTDPRYYNPMYPGDHSPKELVNFLPLQLVTLVGAVVALGRYPFPFLTIVITNLLWYIVFDWTATYADTVDGPLWSSAIYGAACVGIAYVLDRVKQQQLQQQQQQQDNGKDWAFWIYLVGGVIFWTGFMLPQFWYDNNELKKFFNFFINITLIVLAVTIKRRIFMITGLIGALVYLMHLNDLFGDYVLFPFVLTLVGGSIVTWGLYRNRLVNDEMLTQLLANSENNREQTNGMSLHERPTVGSRVADTGDDSAVDVADVEQPESPTLSHEGNRDD